MRMAIDIIYWQSWLIRQCFISAAIRPRENRPSLIRHDRNVASAMITPARSRIDAQIDAAGVILPSNRA